MPSERRPPHRFIDEIPAGPSAIEPVGTGVPAFVGIAPRGPIDEARHVASWADFETLYGGLHAGSALGYTVSHYFSNGGGEAYILRLSTSEPATDPDGFLQAALPATRDGGLYLLDRIDHFTLLVARTGRLACLAEWPRSATRPRSWSPTRKMSTPVKSSRFPAHMRRARPSITPGCSRLTRWPGRMPRSRRPRGRRVYARTDASRGVWIAPRGRAPRSPGAPSDEDVDRRGGRPAQPAWRQCAASAPQIRHRRLGRADMRRCRRACVGVEVCPVRRLALSIEESLARGLAWAAFEPNDESLGAKMRAMVSGFLDGLYRAGAFQGASRATPASSNCDRDTMTQADLDRDVASSSWFRAAQASRVRDRPHRAAHRQLSRQACFDGGGRETRPRDRSLAPYRYLIRWDGRPVASFDAMSARDLVPRAAEAGDERSLPAARSSSRSPWSAA